MPVMNTFSISCLAIAVIILGYSIRKAHSRITELLADNFAITQRLMCIERKLGELERGLEQATKMCIAAHAGRAKVVRRLDGITNKLNDTIKTNKLNLTKK